MKCSFKIPLKAFKFEDDFFDYITLESRFKRNNISNKSRKFIDELDLRLNKISCKDFLWMTLGRDNEYNLIIKLETTFKDFTMKMFEDTIQSEILPILNSLVVDENKIQYSSWYKPSELKMEQ